VLLHVNGLIREQLGAQAIALGVLSAEHSQTATKKVVLLRLLGYRCLRVLITSIRTLCLVGGAVLLTRSLE
jgi:hypothetical protein